MFRDSGPDIAQSCHVVHIIINIPAHLSCHCDWCVEVAATKKQGILAHCLHLLNKDTLISTSLIFFKDLLQVYTYKWKYKLF